MMDFLSISQWVSLDKKKKVPLKQGKLGKTGTLFFHALEILPLSEEETSFLVFVDLNC